MSATLPPPPSAADPTLGVAVPALAPEDAGPPPGRPGIDVPPYRRDGGWGGVLREFGVIVAGVLCALAAQAWWDARQERGREHDYLRQLLSDTRENERRLDAAIRVDSTAGRFMARALDALTSTAPAPPADSVVGWILRAGVASDVQALTGNYQALIGTGDLRLVRNDSLRALLASYAAALENESARQGQFRYVVSSQAGSMARALPFTRRIFLGDVSAAGVDVGRLRADPDVAAVLFSMQAANANRVAGLRVLRDQSRRMRRALEAEPALRPS